MQKILLVGLGNPGSEYAGTRHNIGFDVVDAWVKRLDGRWRVDRLAEVAEVKWKGRTFICIKPTTYMNLSGRAFRYWMDKEKITLENTLTVVDDLALPITKLRIRKSGSDAGHNGLKDIQAILGTPDYPKLRFGIGASFPKGRQADFVLGKWLPAELPVVQEKVEACMGLLELLYSMGIEAAMNKANATTFKP